MYYNRKITPALMEDWKVTTPRGKVYLLAARVVPTEGGFYAHARFANTQPADMYVCRARTFRTVAEARADLLARVDEKATFQGCTVQAPEAPRPLP
jgi:hypothetical protein